MTPHAAALSWRHQKQQKGLGSQRLLGLRPLAALSLGRASSGRRVPVGGQRPAAPLRSWEHTPGRVSKTQAVLRGGLAAGCVRSVCMLIGQVMCAVHVSLGGRAHRRGDRKLPLLESSLPCSGEAHSQRPFLGSPASARWGLWGELPAPPGSGRTRTPGYLQPCPAAHTHTHTRTQALADGQCLHLKSDPSVVSHCLGPIREARTR